MKVAVIGAGAIGCTIGGYLAHAGEDVTFLGRADQVSALRKNGLTIDGVRGAMTIAVQAAERLSERPDVILLSVKTNDITEAALHIRTYDDGIPVVTMQNGVRSDELLSALIGPGDIISSVVMFGSTYMNPGRVVHNFEGDVVIGRAFGENDERVSRIAGVLSKAFPTTLSDDIHSVHWMKLLLNLNNALPGIIGETIQKTFKNVELSRIGIELIQEGIAAMDGAGIRPAPLPNFPVSRLRELVSMPTTQSAGIFSGIMSSLSEKPLYGSILQSIMRGKKSEIDYLNGEIAALSEASGRPAPLNSKAVELVHEVESSRRFYSSQQVIEQFNRLL